MANEYTDGFEDLIDTTPKPDTFPYPVDERAGWRIARSIGYVAAERGQDVTILTDEAFWMMYGLAHAYVDAMSSVLLPAIGSGGRAEVTYRLQEVVDHAVQHDEAARAWINRNLSPRRPAFLGDGSPNPSAG